jgi:hypothetical protein
VTKLPLTLPRRETMLAAGAAGLALAAGAEAQPAATVARGLVYEETGPARRGLAGIMVSNGEDVVLTDAEGRWSLPLADGDSVFVIKPTGWTTPIDPVTQLQHFTYLHRPQGTPESLQPRFPGVAPTGDLPASIDFALRRQDEPTRFDALLLTDPQPETLTELGYIRDDVVAQLTEFPAAFGICHGDLMFDDLSAYDRYNRMIGTIGLPWHNCPGNHDMNLEAPDNALSRETYKRVFGTRYHAFQYGGATFFVLDNVEYLGTDPSKPFGSGKYQGRFGPRQLAFVRAVLAQVQRDSLVVVSHHIPLHTLVGDTPNVANTDTADLLAALAAYPNCVSFSGHTHTNEHWYLGPDGKAAETGHHHHVLSAVSGSWWSGPDDVRGIPAALATDGSPNGFHILSVDGNQATTRLVPAHDPQRSLLRIVLDSQLRGSNPEVLHETQSGAVLTGPVAAAAVASTRVVVNFFEGGPRSTVTLAVGSGTPVAMRRVQRIDPFVQEVYGRNPAATKPWVKPELSSHVWQTNLPGGLGAGAHRVTVLARDEHGRSHSAAMVLEVV